MYLISSILLVCLVASASSRLSNETKPIEVVIRQLFDRVSSYQVVKEKHATPPFGWYEKLGLFKSDIRFNFFGTPFSRGIRVNSAVEDNNMFNTGWIVVALLESGLYGRGAPQYSPEKLELALNAIDSFRDLNEHSPTSLIRTFWQQELNESSQTWTQQPTNIINLVRLLDKPVDVVIKLLKLVHLNKLVPVLDHLKQLIEESTHVFSIPADLDDTYLNLGIGALLKRLKTTYSSSYQSWIVRNKNMSGLVERTMAYTYDPFDLSDLNKNTIDPRSYFCMHQFLHKVKASSSKLSLFTTWVQNLDEQRVLKEKGVSMPFNVNNVDITVAANVIYGITAAALSNLNDFDQWFLNSTELQQAYLNSTHYLSWSIISNFSSRPELASLYYPSQYNLLWFGSRTLFLIQNELKLPTRGHLKKILEEARSYLKEAYEFTVTSFLLEKRIEVDSKSVYFRDFLGLNDTDKRGRARPSNDDALFSTAQAINILIATWATQNKQGSLEWSAQAPQKVKDLTRRAVNWLCDNMFKYKPFNAFFSGSDKGAGTTTFLYPANFLQFLNGTNVTNADNVPLSEFNNLISGVQGVVDEIEYQKMLQQKHFGQKTPLDFHGYNIKGGYFPFWSSEPYTYAVSLLALSQFNNLI